MDVDDTDRILQMLNELEEISSDVESIVSDNADINDHELMIFDKENETVNTNSGNLDLFQYIDVSDPLLFSVINEGKQITLKHFRPSVAIALIGTAIPSPREVKKTPKRNNAFKPKVLYEKRYNAVYHMPLRTNSRRCANCSTRNEPHRTKWSCSVCEVDL